MARGKIFGLKYRTVFLFLGLIVAAAYQSSGIIGLVEKGRAQFNSIIGKG